MKGFAPGLFDKLMGDGDAGASYGTVMRLNLEELKDSVARDLESLLNTRAVLHDDVLAPYVACKTSVVAYGLKDFAGMSLASTDDRAEICRCLAQTISRHESRLRDVKASLAVENGAINRLSFIINAILVLKTASQPVSFDAVLQPSTLKYSISKARHTAVAGA
jgi:type VI secretion system protein ImpF